MFTKNIVSGWENSNGPQKRVFGKARVFLDLPINEVEDGRDGQ